MSDPYRVAALVEEDPPRASFRYVVVDDDGYCPCCGKFISGSLSRFYKLCSPFRRVTVPTDVPGWLFGYKKKKRKCPLGGMHGHHICACGAHVVTPPSDVEVKEEPFPEGSDS